MAKGSCCHGLVQPGPVTVILCLYAARACTDKSLLAVQGPSLPNLFFSSIEVLFGFVCAEALACDTRTWSCGPSTSWAEGRISQAAGPLLPSEIVR
jgi:hypothetical protein